MQNNEPWASEGEYPINGFVRFLMFWNVILVFMTPMLYERSSRSQAAKNRRTGDDLSSRRLKCEQQTEFLEWELLKLFHCSYLKTYSSPNLFKWVDLCIVRFQWSKSPPIVRSVLYWCMLMDIDKSQSCFWRWIQHEPLLYWLQSWWYLILLYLTIFRTQVPTQTFLHT